MQIDPRKLPRKRAFDRARFLWGWLVLFVVWLLIRGAWHQMR